MPEEVHWDAGSEVIRVRAWGHGTIEEWRRSEREFLRLHAEHGATRVLVDVREQLSAPGILDIFEFASDWHDSLRLAIVLAETTREEQTFMANVAANRGRVVGTFSDPAAALEWLLR